MNSVPSPARPSLIGRLLDSSILFSFDRTGYRRHAAAFEAGDLDVDLAGRVAAVTGANSGIGFAIAGALAELGAEVHMLCRSEQRGQTARDELVERTGGDLRLAIVDVSDGGSVARFVGEPGFDRLDVLVHNAGALLDERQLTADGLEVTLATHVVGPMRLTVGLMGRLRARAGRPPARVVWVSSGGMYSKRLSVARLGETGGPFDGVAAYADCKRAQVVLSEQLAARLDPAAVTSSAMHPGWAGTPGVARSLPRFHAITRRILRSPEEGADTAVWLAACPRLAGESGRFWFDRRAVTTHLRRATREDAGERDRLCRAVREWADVEGWDEALGVAEAARASAGAPG